MTKTFQQRPIALAAELLGVALLLAACGGGSGTSSESQTSATTEETVTEASAVNDNIAAEAAAAQDENAAKEAAGTGPSATDPVEEAAVEEGRASAQATGFAGPKVAALEYTWTTSAAQQALLARFNFAVIDKGRMRGAAAYNTFVGGIKARNPGTKVAQYVINGELRCNTDQANFNNLVNAANAADYWLRFTNGAKAQWTRNYGACDINLSQWGKRNAQGQNWVQYKWQQDRNAFYGATPRMDYVWIDTVFINGRSTANWKRNGVNMAPSTPDVAASYRSMQAAYVNELRRTNPTVKAMANTDNDLSSPQYAGLFEGGFLEAEMGKSWSTERIRGWNASLQRYRAVMRNTRGPKDVIYEAIGGKWDYRAMRYGLGTALMDNGYYMYRTTNASDAPFWYDEFSAPLGAATQAPPGGPAQNGIWTRTFQNGIVLLNPQNWSATITIPANYKRLRGTQAPGVNNGAYQNVITLGPKDALVMIRR